jgi:hypothetical protein
VEISSGFSSVQILIGDTTLYRKSSACCDDPRRACWYSVRSVRDFLFSFSFARRIHILFVHVFRRSYDSSVDEKRSKVDTCNHAPSTALFEYRAPVTTPDITQVYIAYGCVYTGCPKNLLAIKTSKAIIKSFFCFFFFYNKVFLSPRVWVVVEMKYWWTLC